MRYALAFMVVALPVSAQEGLLANDLSMSATDLDSHLRGQVLEFFDGSKSRYGSDSRYGYTYTDDGPVWAGEYQTFDDSRVCVAFDNGSERCDTIVLDGSRTILITDEGLRFPVRNMTVDGQ